MRGGDNIFDLCSSFENVSVPYLCFIRTFASIRTERCTRTLYVLHFDFCSHICTGLSFDALFLEVQLITKSAIFLQFFAPPEYGTGR
jgi:hypothetical protein